MREKGGEIPGQAGNDEGKEPSSSAFSVGGDDGIGPID